MDQLLADALFLMSRVHRNVIQTEFFLSVDREEFKRDESANDHAVRHRAQGEHRWLGEHGFEVGVCGGVLRFEGEREDLHELAEFCGGGERVDVGGHR